MKYKVIRYFTKLSEGLKPYNVGSEIELSKEEAKALIANGYIKELKTVRVTKEHKPKRKTK